MNSAAQLDNELANWIAQGLSKAEIVVKQAEFMMEWPYAWGAVGADCTVAKREYYMNRSAIGEGDKELIRKRCQVLNGSADSCSGCKYYPNGARVRMNDCQGFAKSVFKGVGITLAGGGCTSMWNTASNWKEQGYLADMPAGQVCLVFKYISSTQKMDHVGIHIGGGNIIHCSGDVRRGTTKEKGWTHYGIPKGLDGSTPSDKPTLRKGSTGPYVVECQNDLLQLGYDLSPYGADGKYGNTTIREVKKFQSASGLVADGICGQKTWTALDEAVGPSPTPTTKLYTVHIPHLTEYQADALIATYSGSWKTEE